MGSPAPKTVIIIPARYESSRFPGKPLTPLRGASGHSKPLIQRSYEAAVQIEGVADVYVATDHDGIAAAVRDFGGKAVMTSSDCRNGTERCADTLSHLPDRPELVINLQGDAPLTPPHFVKALIAAYRDGGSTTMFTPAVRCGFDHLAKLRAEEKVGRVGGTTVVRDRRGHALYFSKRLIPHFPESADGDGASPVFLHIGLYAYTPAALAAYAAAPPGALEEYEGLEQLRFLEEGLSVKVVEVEPPAWEIWELNNPSDVAPIEAALAIMGAE